MPIPLSDTSNRKYDGYSVIFKSTTPPLAWLARVISFEAFSMMVDEALERMKKMLESNKAMQTLVSGEAGEVNE